jgi:hypothetical protein
MSLNVANEIDAVGFETDTDVVVLSIVDSWNWEDERAHLQALQDKLNAYLAFVESGEIYGAYPNAATKALRIDVIARHQPPATAIAFLEKASAVASQLGLTIRHRVHPGSSDAAI